MQFTNLFAVFMIAAGVSAKCIDRGETLCAGDFSFRCAIGGDPNQDRCCDTLECVCESENCIDA